jgi:hypothetical protein
MRRLSATIGNNDPTCFLGLNSVADVGDDDGCASALNHVGSYVANYTRFTARARNIKQFRLA